MPFPILIFFVVFGFFCRSSTAVLRSKYYLFLFRLWSFRKRIFLKDLSIWVFHGRGLGFSELFLQDRVRMSPVGNEGRF